MEYEQALIIGRWRRADAAMALAGYVRERVTEVCAVKPSKDSGLDARDWEPVGEESFKEICIRTGLTGDKHGLGVCAAGYMAGEVKLDGRAVRYLARSLETKKGRVSFSVPLALNEPEGRYTLTFTDVPTRASATVALDVQP